MNRVIFVPIALMLSAAHCTSQSAKPVSPKIEKPAPPPIKEMKAPVGYELLHFGAGAGFRALIKVLDPQLFKRWTQGDLIVLQGKQSRCSFLRLGHEIETLSPCPETRGVEPKPMKISLTPTIFGQPLKDGTLLLEPGSVDGSASVPSDWLNALLKPMRFPDVDLTETLDVRTFGQPDGTGFAFEFELAEEVLERLGRFDLSKRYGGFADYVRDVRAWGDGHRFQWILRLDGGGVGLRLEDRRVRLALQTGAVWKEQLDALLRATQTHAIQIPVLSVPDLSIMVEEGIKLRLHVEQKPLPSRAVLRQLSARLTRWLAKAEEEQ